MLHRAETIKSDVEWEAGFNLACVLKSTSSTRNTVQVRGILAAEREVFLQ